MFITKSRHNRNGLGERSGLGRFCGVNDSGLGVVVTQTTKFDPGRMKNRFVYWLETAAEEMANQVREQIKQEGGEPGEDSGSRNKYKQAAINSIPFNDMTAKVRMAVASWSTAVTVPKPPSMASQLAKLYIGLFTPWISVGMMLFGMFGKKKKPKISVPWNAIYAQALPFAQETTVNEELNRIAEEVQYTKEVRTKAVEKSSQEGAKFKLPEGVTAIKRGALVLALKGGPVEKRI